VFTGAFLEGVAGMVGEQPTEADLTEAAARATDLLVAGVASSAIVPDFFSQVAANMIAADQHSFGGRDTHSLQSAFVRHGILTAESASAAAQPSTVAALLQPMFRTSPARGAAPWATSADVGIESALVTAMPMMGLSGARFGLGETTLRVHAPAETHGFGVTGMTVGLQSAPPTASAEAVGAFVTYLFQRGRVDLREASEAALVQPRARKTHLVVREGDELVLQRVSFDCGFD
jgi:hypothetical protein